jgi:hypothetical protein
MILLYRIIVQGFLKRAQRLGEVFPDVLSLDPRFAQIPYRGQSSRGLSIRDAPLPPGPATLTSNTSVL